jgi:hypothetical protein
MGKALGRGIMKHCILVKWSEEIADKHEIVNKVKIIFDKLLEIKGIHKVKYVENCIDRSNRFDLLIRIDMDKEVLPIYDVSSPHLEWKEKYGKFAEKKAIFDFEE